MLALQANSRCWGWREGEFRGREIQSTFKQLPCSPPRVAEGPEFQLSYIVWSDTTCAPSGHMLQRLLPKEAEVGAQKPCDLALEGEGKLSGGFVLFCFPAYF